MSDSIVLCILFVLLSTGKFDDTLEEHSVSYKTVERIQRGSQQKGEIKKKWSTQLKQGQRNKMTKAATSDKNRSK